MWMVDRALGLNATLRAIYVYVRQHVPEEHLGKSLLNLIHPNLLTGMLYGPVCFRLLWDSDFMLLLIPKDDLSTPSFEFLVFLTVIWL